MRFAYADPPYPGKAHKHYKDDPQHAEVDHPQLIQRLIADYPDGWALSTSSVALPALLPWCPKGTRIMAWVKPFAIYKPGVNPAYAWEPLLVYGGRKYARYDPTVRDWVSANVTIQKGVHGTKPEAFVLWLFQVLNLQVGDTLDDLFPGSGIVSRLFHERFMSPKEEASPNVPI